MANQEMSADINIALTNFELNRKKAETLRGLWIDQHIVPVSIPTNYLGTVALDNVIEPETA